MKLLCSICRRPGHADGMAVLCSRCTRIYLFDSKEGYIRRRKRGGKWKGIWPSQRDLTSSLEALYSPVHHEVAFLGCRSPKGACLRFDICLPREGVLVEYDGSQHGEWERYFHRTKAKWKYMKLCRGIKEEWARSEGWRLVILTFEDKPFLAWKLREMIDDTSLQ